MNKNEAIKELESMDSKGDQEILHARADEILLEYLKSTGDAEIAQSFQNAKERVRFWYA